MKKKLILTPFVLAFLSLNLSANSDLLQAYEKEVDSAFLNPVKLKSIDEDYCQKGLVEACISKANTLKELENFEKQYKTLCDNNDKQACSYESLILLNKINIFTREALKQKDESKIQSAKQSYDELSQVLNQNQNLNIELYKAYSVLSSSMQSLKLKEDKAQRLEQAINGANNIINSYEKEPDSKDKFLKLYSAYNFLSTLGSGAYDKVFLPNESIENLKTKHKEYDQKAKSYLNNFLKSKS
ncbi:TPA: hypothetical protein SB541_001314 [Campylobacter jejuni]|nr:hypothetical protein [Campylobacter jejuni]HEG0497348.1 hypothetical protein [Campylobacter jejuni]